MVALSSTAHSAANTAALWAVDDKATMWFLNRFYEHLVHGESASESLHQAMKSMREARLFDIMQWAPFILIGDNVTFKGLYFISFLGFLVILVKICEIDVGGTTHHFEKYYYRSYTEFS